MGQSLKYQKWKHNKKWMSSSNPCEWYGVTCDLEGHVIQLILKDNGLEGRIDPSIGNLTRLQVLNLNGKRPASYHGCTTTNLGNTSIPEEIGRLDELQELWLEYSCLSGSIPASIGRLTSLRVLKLHANFLHGNLPVSALDQLTALETFDLGRNPLSGPFPLLPSLTRLQKFRCALKLMLPVYC
jgi:hypothetical protein